MLTALLFASGAWADEVTVTYAYNKINATGTGTASVNGVMTSMTVSKGGSLYSFNGTGSAATYNSVSVPQYSKITVSSSGTSSSDDYIRFTITPASGYTFSPSSVSLGAIREGTDAGSMTVSANNAALTESTLSKTSVVPGRNKSGTDASSITKYTKDGYTFSYSISSIDATSDAPLNIDVCMSGLKDKSWGIWNVVITGTYSFSSLDKLSAPSVSINQLSGLVTISAIDANASKVTYTTDGTAPTASSTTYSSPFTVDADCTIKAIAIGDGVSYSNSSITSQAAVVSVANPVITAHNGTVGITCATDGSTIKYNFDNGESWTTYSIPFTLFEGQTVYAKAENASYKNSTATANKTVSAAPAASAGSYSITLYYDVESNFILNTEGNSDVLTGKTGTDYEGYVLTLDNEGKTGGDIKSWGYGSAINEKTSLKGSNGRKVTISLPTNLKANRITIYSYNNGAISSASLWSEVGGTTYTESNEISLQSVSNASNPDVRVFELDNLNEITLKNNGAQQQCFIAVIDYLEFIPSPAIETETADAITWDFTNQSAKTFENNKTYSYKATDGTTEMRYTAGSSCAMVAKDGSTDGYLKENGTTGGASAKDIDGTTTIAKNRVIRLFVTGSGKLQINCNATNKGVWKVYDSNAAKTASNGTALISALNADTQSDLITVTNALWIETSTKGYITSIVWTPMTETGISVDVTSVGWATLFTPSFAVNVPTGATAYYVSDIDDTNLTLSAIGEGQVIPANTGVLVSGNEGKYTFNKKGNSDPDPVEIETNYLKGLVNTGTTTGAGDGGKYYRLSYETDPSTDLGFYYGAAEGAAFTIEAYKAYLAVPSSKLLAAAPSMFRIIAGENNATSINDIEATDEAVKFIQNGQLFIKKNGVIYDTMGRVIR